MTESPNPSPSPTPSPSPVPTPSPSFNFDYFNDKTVEILDSYEIRFHLKKILSTTLKVTKSNIEIERFGNNLILTIDNIESSEVKKTDLFNLKNKLIEYYFNYYKKIYKQTKDDVFKISKDRIVIEFVPGSLIVSIKILKENQTVKLTQDEKDLLEYYNYIRVFHRGLQPITEFEYKKLRQLSINRKYNTYQ